MKRETVAALTAGLMIMPGVATAQSQSEMELR